jgi:hypothetical protein
MNTQKKLFAFKLAEKQSRNIDQNDGKWKARDGVAIAGCCAPATNILWPMNSLGIDHQAPCV